MLTPPDRDLKHTHARRRTAGRPLDELRIPLYAPLMRNSVGALLAAKQSELLERWQYWVKVELTSSNMSDGELVDSMPLFIENLVALADGPLEPGDPRAARPESARAHAQDRLRIGFDVSTVVREYGLLRRSILEIAEAAGVTLVASEISRVFEVISLAEAEAVAEYQRQRDQEQARQASEHLAFLAHELRNPLSSALTAFVLLRGNLLADGGRLVDVLERSLRRTSQLLDDALLAGRLHGAPVLHREPFDLSKVARETADELAVDAEHRKLELEVEVEPPVTVQADPRMIRSVLSNLVRNGIKFSRPGTRVTVRVHRAEQRVVLEVEDGCGGLPSEKMHAIFDPHVQIGADRSGFGLGLAIAKQAAEAHDGTLQVHSIEGQGCLFRLELPA